MKKFLTSTLLATSCLFTAHSHADIETTCQQPKSEKASTAWSGHYYLQGVMEVGSELLLKPDGTFKWYLAVGALDQYAEGKWWQNESCIGLKAAPEYKASLEIFPIQLKIQEKILKAVWSGGREQGAYIRAEPHSDAE